MSETDAHLGDQVTLLLQRAGEGDREAEDAACRLVRDALRQMAARRMSQREQLSLEASMLAHDVFLKLIRNPSISWESRRHFFGFAAGEIRKLLIDYARKRKAQKRNSGERPASIDAVADPASPAGHFDGRDPIDLDAALQQLERTHPQLAESVKLSYFTGLSSREIGELLECNTGTVNRRLAKARMLLRDFMTHHGDDRTDL